MRVRHEVDFWLTVCVLIVSAVGITMSLGCGYEPWDEHGQRHRPWNEDPYAETDDLSYFHLYTESEAARKIEYKETIQSKDWVDSVRR